MKKEVFVANGRKLPYLNTISQHLCCVQEAHLSGHSGKDFFFCH